MRINSHQRAFKKEHSEKEKELGRKPDWLRIKIPIGKNYAELKKSYARAETEYSL